MPRNKIIIILRPQHDILKPSHIWGADSSEQNAGVLMGGQERSQPDKVFLEFMTISKDGIAPFLVVLQ